MLDSGGSGGSAVNGASNVVDVVNVDNEEAVLPKDIHLVTSSLAHLLQVRSIVKSSIDDVIRSTAHNVKDGCVVYSSNGVTLTINQDGGVTLKTVSDVILTIALSLTLTPLSTVITVDVIGDENDGIVQGGRIVCREYKGMDGWRVFVGELIGLMINE
jgi:hypothetical protein